MQHHIIFGEISLRKKFFNELGQIFFKEFFFKNLFFGSFLGLFFWGVLVGKLFLREVFEGSFLREPCPQLPRMPSSEFKEKKCFEASLGHV